MNKYQNGKIYKIINDVDDMVYVGSTYVPLQKRWKGHVQTLYSNTSKRKIYEHMRNIGIDHFRIILIYEYPCKDKHELLWKETEEINKFDKKNSLNERCAIFKLTDKKGKERKSEYDEIYRKNNIERKRENDRKWCYNNLEYKHARDREYVQKHRDKNIQKCKEWSEQNKEYLKEYRKQFFQKTKWLKLLPLHDESKKETHLYF